ncbi:MAG TPA: fibronectin type III domain-containing protein [Acidobacteriota bacterium]|nr:fibronectin type III domain-containing protein [Acidobacteriota bacterium]
MQTGKRLLLASLLALLTVVSCGDEKSTDSTDSTPPAVVTDLGVVDSTHRSVTLGWTAPGDDGTEGTAARYDIRYALTEITASNWDDADTVATNPVPGKPGKAVTFAVESLLPETRYFFGLRTADEAENWSAPSNVVSATTLSAVDTLPPETVTDLVVSDVTLSSITLTWTAPGDSGSGVATTAYDIRYSVTGLTESVWQDAPQATAEPAPGPKGQSESFTIEGLTAGTTYFFGIKSVDAVGRWSALSNVAIGITTYTTTTTWQKTVGNALDDAAVAVTAAPGGGYAIAGTARIPVGDDDTQGAIFLLRIDESGTALWENRISSSDDPPVAAIAAAPDGGFLTVGTWNDYGVPPFNHDMYVLRVDGQGNYLWTETYGDAAGVEDWGTDIIPGHDGGYIVAGTFKAAYSHYLARIDETGAIIWQQEIIAPVSPVWTAAIAATSDQGYVIGGSRWGRSYIAKTDGTGNMEWETRIDGTIDAFPQDILALDDGYLIAGYGREGATLINDAYFLRTDLNGDVLWEKIFAGSGNDYLWAAVRMPGGDFLAVGTTESSGAGGSDVYLMRVDDDGNLVSETTFGGGGDDAGNDIIATRDGGFLIVGTTRSFGAGGSDVYLIKLDANGEL